MKTTPIVLHAVLVVAGVCVAAGEKDAGFPDAELKAYLQAKGLPLLQPKPGSRLQRDFDARWLAWCRRVTFLITCHHAAVTVEINGRKVFAEITPMKFYQPHEKLADFEGGYVGFCNKLFHAGNETRILKCEVRRLPADFNPPAAATLDDASQISEASHLLAYLEGTQWTPSMRNAEAAGEVLFGSAKREFWFRGAGDESRHLLFNVVDALTLDLENGAHRVRFGDDHRSFSISDWPKKGGTASWTFQSRADPAGERVPFDFAGTTWRRSDSTIEFAADGSWRFPEGKKLFEGEWNKVGARTAAAYRTDLTVENFEVSADGRWLMRGDGKNWRKETSD